MVNNNVTNPSAPPLYNVEPVSKETFEVKVNKTAITIFAFTAISGAVIAGYLKRFKLLAVFGCLLAIIGVLARKVWRSPEGEYYLYRSSKETVIIKENF